MEELLMCSVCIERYHEKERHPVLLPRCGHSFCRPCVAMLIAQGCIVCPTCRSDQRIESADKLPTEYTLLGIIRAQEESKKEVCERHSVKLSFWCRTCSIATCGECLFEDHPTHSHDVTKASKYIGEMKQNAYDIAVKFMEVLDEREQNFYRSIFSSAKKISNALRNVGTLRKDMEEARELMKGIKEEDTISSATSLNEAAKFLGLKWNIQDANIYQNIGVEKEEDGKMTGPDEKTDKEKILEEEQERELAKIKSKQDKEARRALRKSKTMSVVEMSKVNTEMTERDVLNKLEAIAETSVTDDMKKEIEDLVKPKGAIEKKEEPAKKEELSTNEEQANKEEPTNKEEPAKKEPEATTKPSTKPKEVVKNELDPIKFKEELNKLKGGLKRTEDQPVRTETPIPPVDSSPRSKQDARKEKAIASQKKYINRTLTAKAEKEKTVTVTPTPTPEEVMSPEETRVSSPTPSEEAASSTKDDKDDVQEESEIGEEMERLQEEIKVTNESGDIKSDVESVNPDSGLSEDSKASKTKKEEKPYEPKLQDCIQVPGFMIAVEADDGRLGQLQWGPQGLHVHCMEFHAVTYDIVIKANILNTMVPSMHPIAFMELSADETVLGRVYIRLWGHLKRAHNFLTLCIGDRGKSYLNTKFLQVYNVGQAGERMLGGDYESNNGRGGKGIIDDLEWNSDYAMPMKAGMITAAGTGQSCTNSLFLLCSQSDPERNFSCPFGLVCEGLKVVKEAVQQAVTKDVCITDCGVLLVPPRSDVSKYFS